MKPLLPIKRRCAAPVEQALPCGYAMLLLRRKEAIAVAEGVRFLQADRT
ncbi:hypothetical protein [Paenibacillus sp. DRB1-1]